MATWGTETLTFQDAGWSNKDCTAREDNILFWDWSSFVSNKKAITIKKNIFEIENFIQAPPFNDIHSFLHF